MYRVPLRSLREGPSALKLVSKILAGRDDTYESMAITGYSIFITDNNTGGAGYAMQLIDHWAVWYYAEKLLDYSCDNKIRSSSYCINPPNVRR